MLQQFLTFASRFQAKEIHTTYFSFKLVTRITVNILFFIILAMFSSAFVAGNVIECYTDDWRLARLISSKCWAEGVYIDLNLLNETIGKTIIAPGVGHFNRMRIEKYFHQTYYQWIPPLLILNALLLYLPRGLWRLWEGGVMAKLIEVKDGVKLAHPIINDKWKDRRNHLVSYMRNVNKKYHRRIVFKYFCCELLSIAAIILNMFLMKWIINDFWVEYQPAILAISKGDFDDFRRKSAILFPLQARCIYYTIGHSGSMQVHDVLCYMPLNVVNEKVFIFFYFWYIALLLFATCNLIYFFIMLCFSSLRVIDIGRMCDKLITRKECQKISGNGDVGLWFTLHVISMNLDPVFFQDLIKELNDQAKKIENPFHNASAVITCSVSDKDKEKY